MEVGVKREIGERYHKLDQGWQGRAVGYSTLGIAGGLVGLSAAYWYIGMMVGGGLRDFRPVIDAYKWFVIAGAGASMAVALPLGTSLAKADEKEDRQAALKRYLNNQDISLAVAKEAFSEESSILDVIDPMIRENRLAQLRKEYNAPWWMSGKAAGFQAILDGETERLDEVIAPSSADSEYHSIPPGSESITAREADHILEKKRGRAVKFKFLDGERVTIENLRIAWSLADPEESGATGKEIRALIAAHQVPEGAGKEELHAFVKAKGYAFSGEQLEEVIAKIRYVDK